MELSLLIDDSVTLTDHVPASGFHPTLEIVYRPALHKERNVYQTKINTKDPDVIDRYESELIARQVTRVNDVQLKGNKDAAARLHPVVRGHLLDLLLCVTAPMEAKTEGESSGG